MDKRRQLHQKPLPNSLAMKKLPVRVIADSREGRQLTKTCLLTSEALGLDLEGVNLGAQGQITLIQVGTPFSIYIFDMLVQGMSEVLRPVLESPVIVKVIHDCKNDAVNLRNQYGITLTNVFDTQVAYVVTNSDASTNYNIGYNTLCSKLNLEGNTLKEKVSKIYCYNHMYWLRRPLTTQMIDYASSDISSLLFIYAELLPLIHDKSSFNELSFDQINALILPDEVKARRRLRSVRKDEEDFELLKILKRKLESSNPTKLILSDREIGLAKHLDLAPGILQQLHKNRGAEKVDNFQTIMKGNAEAISMKESARKYAKPPEQFNQKDDQLKTDQKLEGHGRICKKKMNKCIDMKH